MTDRRPLIGVTADINWHAHSQPPRLHYELDEHITRCLFDAGSIVSIIPHESDDPIAWLEWVDGVVLSGGAWLFPRPRITDAFVMPNANAHKHRRAHFELNLARAAIERDVPLLGICGGFQVLNVAAGGSLHVDLRMIGAQSLEHSGLRRDTHVHSVQPEEGTMFSEIVGTQPFRVNSQHRQGVDRVGAAARVSAHAHDGLVEAVEIPGRRFCLGVQWHPEFQLCEQDQKLVRHFVSAAVQSTTNRPPRA